MHYPIASSIYPRDSLHLLLLLTFLIRKGSSRPSLLLNFLIRKHSSRPSLLLNHLICKICCIYHHCLTA